MKSDADLKRDVLAELEWDPAVDAAAIGVEVKYGIATLSGHLDSFAEKLAVERAVQRVAGVKGLSVELTVKVPGSCKRTDAEIAFAANQALKWHSMVPEDCIRLRVEAGWITLTGETDWAYQRNAAEAAVRDLVSVRGVSNQIRIRSKTTSADLKAKIEAALHRAATFDACDIKVEIDGDEVILEGTLHSMNERLLAEGAAWAAPGVSRVVDRIRIAA